MCICMTWNTEYALCSVYNSKMVKFYSNCVIYGSIYLREMRCSNGNFYLFSNKSVYICSVIHVGKSTCMSNFVEQTPFNAYLSLN